MKVLDYKGNELFLCIWLEKPCIMASQIGEVLRAPGRSVAEVIRTNPVIFKPNEDFSVIKSNDAKLFRNQIKEAGKDKFFASSTILYKTGIEKYITHMKFSTISNEIRDFSLFLSKEGIIDRSIELHKTISLSENNKKESVKELPEYKQRLMLELYECVKTTPIPADIKAKFLIDILENRVSDSIDLLKKWLIDLKVYVS